MNNCLGLSWPKLKIHTHLSNTNFVDKNRFVLYKKKKM